MKRAWVQQASALLLLLLGTIGGAAGGGAMVLFLSRSKRVAPPPVAVPAPAPLPTPDLATAVVAPPSPGPADAGSADLAATTSPRGRLLVQVLDVGGRPVAGAAVHVRPVAALGTPGSVGELGVLAGPLPFPEDVIAGAAMPTPGLVRGANGETMAVATTSTDAQGHAELDAVGHVLVVAAAQGLEGTTEVLVPPGAPVEKSSAKPDDRARGPSLRLILRLAAPPSLPCLSSAESESTEPVSAGPGPELAGQLLNGRGFPVAAAVVEAQVGKTRVSGLTSPQGQFSLRGLPLGTLTLSVRARGYAPLRVQKGAEESRSELRLTLQPGAGIAGTVRDARLGSAPSGLELALSVAGESQTISTNTDGRFQATSLPVGSATLRARAKGYAEKQLRIELVAGSEPDQVTVRDLRIELEREAELRGQVRGPSGPVAGATIEARTADGQSFRALSDERGEYVLGGLPSGRLTIEARANAGSERAPLRASTTVELRSEARERADLLLDRGSP